MDILANANTRWNIDADGMHEHCIVAARTRGGLQAVTVRFGDFPPLYVNSLPHQPHPPHNITMVFVTPFKLQTLHAITKVIESGITEEAHRHRQSAALQRSQLRRQHTTKLFNHDSDIDFSDLRA